MKTYCTQNNGDCETCSLVNYGRDCRNVPIERKEILFDYVEFSRGGGCRIIEPRIPQARALELVEEIQRFNTENATGLYYRAILSAAVN